jgi:dihydrofolate synthase/folylpolyglutamate synthase
MTEHLRRQDAALERLKSLHPQLIDLSLDRVQRLLAAMGRPQDRLPPACAPPPRPRVCACMC